MEINVENHIESTIYSKGVNGEKWLIMFGGLGFRSKGLGFQMLG